jgi:replicative DNA helicase
MARPFDRLPPYDAEAETAVVASPLKDEAGLPAVRELGTPDDFYVVENGLIYAGELACADRGESLNSITVGHELGVRGQLEQVEGIAHLQEMTTELPTTVGVEWYAKIVRDAAVHRRLLSRASQLAREPYRGGPEPDRLSVGCCRNS